LRIVFDAPAMIDAPYLSDAFLDRVRRSYRLALDAGARTTGRTWKLIDARRQDIHDALLTDGNEALRQIFADPIQTDLYYGMDGLCRSFMNSSDGRPFLQLALASYRATLARYQADKLLSALRSICGTAVVEIGPGTGHCAYYAYRDGMTDYTTIDLPLGMVAHIRFLAEALGPDNIWMDGDIEPPPINKIKIFSAARVPDRQTDVVINVDSITEMSIKTALEYVRWINGHARLFISMNHERNLFTVADLAKSRLTAKPLYRAPVPERDGYFEEVFAIDRQLTNRTVDLFRLRSKALVRFFQKAIAWAWRRLPLNRSLLRTELVP
jgi:SAM-dependent methyltransferase